MIFASTFFIFSFAIANGETTKNTTAIKDEQNLPEFANIFVREIFILSYRRSAVEGNANQYLDKLIINLKQFLRNGYDPFRGRDLTSEVKSIELYGLSTIRRVGSSTVKTDRNDLLLNAKIGFASLRGSAEFEKQLWWIFWTSGIAHINIQDIELEFRLRSILKQDIVQFRLEVLHISNWGRLDASLQGTNWLGTIIGWFGGLFPSIVTDWIKSNVPPVLFDGVRDALANVKFSWNDLDLPFGRENFVR